MAQDQMQVDFTQVINELANRLRVLESRQSLLSEKLLVMNQNMIEEYKKTIKEIKIVQVEIRTMKDDVSNVKNVVKHLTEEAGKFAKTSDIRVLEKYIKLWDPLKFVTEKEVKAMIQDALATQKKVKKDGNTSE